MAPASERFAFLRKNLEELIAEVGGANVMVVRGLYFAYIFFSK